MLFALAIVLALGTLVAYWLGARQAKPHEESSVGTVGTSLLGLLVLILAFSFSAAWERFHHRLNLAIDEANAIGTLQLRLDLLPSKHKAVASERLLAYVRERKAFNEGLSHIVGESRPSSSHDAAVKALWDATFEGAAALPHAPDRGLIVHALNETIDLASTRRVQSRTHIPTTIALLLGLVSLLSSYLVGRDLAGKSAASRRVGWAFLICVAGTVFTVFDLENPRLGLIDISQADQLLDEIETSLERSIPSPVGRGIPGLPRGD